MSLTSFSLALILSSNTPSQNTTSALESIQPRVSVPNLSLEARAEESPIEWFERVKSSAKRGECFKKVKLNFPTCVHVNKSIQTTGWGTPDQDYIMLVNCENHPDQNYLSLPASSENIGSEYYCKDSERVWIKRDPVFSDTDANQ